MRDNARRAAGMPLSDQDMQDLQQLASMPDDEIDFSDIPERPSIAANTSLPLENHTVTLQIDREVAAWLEEEGRKNPQVINLLLKRVARQKTLHTATPPALEKAS